MADAGRWMMILGAVLLAVGALLTFGSQLPWFGRLPGDIVFRGNNVTLFIPIGAMIVVSVLLSLILTLVARFFR